MIAFGVLRLIVGIVAAVDGSPEVAAQYLGSETSGQAIGEALWILGSGIVIGILTDISRSLRN